jgi:hypothetical protein
MMLAVGEMGSMKEIEIALADPDPAQGQRHDGQREEQPRSHRRRLRYRGHCNESVANIGLSYARLGYQSLQVVGDTAYDDGCNNSAPRR